MPTAELIGCLKVVVCVVADGRLKINPRTRSVLAALGCYQDGVGKNVVLAKPVVRLPPFTAACIESRDRQRICLSTPPNVSGKE